MKLQVLSAAAVLVGLFTTGCTQNVASDDVAPEAVSTIHAQGVLPIVRPTPKAGELGGTCGTIAGIRCKGGLACSLEGDFPDAGGKCVLEETAASVHTLGFPGFGARVGAAEGQTCGGIAAIRCQTGLDCQLEGDFPDAAGKCMAKSSDDIATVHPLGFPGFGVRVGAGEGETCAGIAAIRCQTGLRCHLEGTFPDAAGTCISDASAN
jgi:hypothetical protein